MKRFICPASKIDLPRWVDKVDRWMRIRRNNIFAYRTSSAVVIGLVGVMEVLDSRSKNIAAFSPLFPAFQGLLHKWVHAGVVDGLIINSSSKSLWPLIALASPADGSPTSRGANTT